MAVLLAALSALAYGLSDFMGGLASRRAPAWSVAFTAQLSSAMCTATVAVFNGGSPTSADLAWSVLAALAAGTGTGFLYRGLSSGRMGVVAPLSAIGAAVIPVVAGLLVGERPGGLVLLGILLGLPAIWLVSSEPGDAGTALATGLGDGLLAGLGFGVMFASLGQVPDTAGLWPLALTQVLSVFVVAAVAVATRAEWLPRAGGSWWGLAAGPLGAAAALAFLLSTQRGYLTVAGVVASLYPAATLLLALVVLRERVHRIQLLGLGICALAIALVAVG